ncbi:hypothetical protein O181_063507 [Austropuccinia psidii MF-1]|uniref:Uncharacterized protein n=1 Tax=Austropuccinia psidii MF-1 TaxID=1389203 RepID=A0A9Q3EPR7_9BASI|nr:hypothetical protein [Austropuccinia psidii MF-1]
MTISQAGPSDVVDEVHTEKNCSDVVYEIYAEECPSDMVDETHTEEAPRPNKPAPQKCIKITGPHHPTLIFSEINNTNILPYQRMSKAYITQASNPPNT